MKFNRFVDYSIISTPEQCYQYGEDIVVYVNDAYWLYTKYSEPEINWDDLTEQEKMMLDPAYKG